MTNSPSSLSQRAKTMDYVILEKEKKKGEKRKSAIAWFKFLEKSTLVTITLVTKLEKSFQISSSLSHGCATHDKFTQNHEKWWIHETMKSFKLCYAWGMQFNSLVFSWFSTRYTKQTFCTVLCLECFVQISKIVSKALVHNTWIWKPKSPNLNL